MSRQEFEDAQARQLTAEADLKQLNSDVDTRAHLDLDIAFDFQGDQLFAQRYSVSIIDWTPSIGIEGCVWAQRLVWQWFSI